AATPCTAPFMGAALGYALTQSTLVIFSVFVALGLGLSLPYLLFAFFPSLTRCLPKPGAWMLTFKHFLAFPMFATTLWLLWLLSQQIGSTSSYVIALALLFFVAAIWWSKEFFNRFYLRYTGFILLLIFSLFLVMNSLA